MTYAYFGTDTLPGRIIRVDLATLGYAGELVLPQGLDRMTAALPDAIGGYAYFTTLTWPGTVIRLRLADFTVDTVLTTNDNCCFSTLAIDPQSGLLYLGGGSTPSVFRVALTDFTWLDHLDVINIPYYDWGSVDSLVIVPGHDAAYAGAYYQECTLGSCVNQPSTLSGIRLSDFTLTGTLDLPYLDDDLTSGAYDPASGDAYYGTGTAPAKVIRVHVPDLTVEGVLALQPGDDDLHTAAVDGDDAYFTTSSGSVIRVRLSDFSRAGALNLSGQIGSALIDHANGFAYYGLRDDSTLDSLIVRVRLSDFSLAGTLLLAQDSEPATASMLDPGEGYAYFGASHGCCPAGTTVYKVRLADFSVAGAFLGTEADLALSASTSQPIRLPGQPLTYTFTLGNAGPRGATGLVLTATLPLSTNFLAASPGCMAQGVLVRCTPEGSLRVGAMLPLTVSVTVDIDAPPGPLVTSALAAATQPDPVPGNNGAAERCTRVARFVPLCSAIPGS